MYGNVALNACKQAGAELGQAQFKLRLNFNLIFVDLASYI